MAEAAAAPAAADVKAAPVPAAGVPIKLVLLVGGAALLLGLGGAIAYFKLTAHQKAEPPAAEAAAPAPEVKAEEHGKTAAPGKNAPGTIFDLEPFIVNLADTPEVRYLKLTLKLELDRADAAADLSGRLPQVRDAILILLSGKDSAALRSTQGKFQLRDDITLRVNAVLPRPGVRTAYFTEFVIQ